MLRPSGIGRYFSAVFLAAWLTGWLIGELVALSFLVVLVRSVAGSVAGLPWPMPGGAWITAGFVFLFLLITIATRST